MRKHYLARVHGLLTRGTSLTVTAPIRVHTAHGATTTMCSDDGKPAQTLIHSIGCDEASCTSLLVCEPVTGRSHQLRLHLQRIGYPIANDPRYYTAESTALRPQKRHCAHHREDDGHGARPATESALSEPSERTELDADSDELWLHAWSYTCESGPRRRGR